MNYDMFLGLVIGVGIMTTGLSVVAIRAIRRELKTPPPEPVVPPDPAVVERVLRDIDRLSASLGSLAGSGTGASDRVA
jgi:hypothetical protein